MTKACIGLVKVGNLKSTRIGLVKVGNISFLVDWRRYWLNWRESHRHLHHIWEIFKAFTSFPKLIAGMLVIIILMLVLATNTGDCDWVLFLVFWNGSRHKIANPFHQSRVDLEVLEAKTLSSPFTTQQRGHWGSYFCQYRHAVLWMIFYCCTTIWKVWPPPPREYWATISNSCKEPLLLVEAPPILPPWSNPSIFCVVDPSRHSDTCKAASLEIWKWTISVWMHSTCHWVSNKHICSSFR